MGLRDRIRARLRAGVKRAGNALIERFIGEGPHEGESTATRTGAWPPKAMGRALHKTPDPAHPADLADRGEWTPYEPDAPPRATHATPTANEPGVPAEAPSPAPRPLETVQVDPALARTHHGDPAGEALSPPHVEAKTLAERADSVVEQANDLADQARQAGAAAEQAAAEQAAAEQATAKQAAAEQVAAAASDNVHQAHEADKARDTFRDDLARAADAIDDDWPAGSIAQEEVLPGLDPVSLAMADQTAHQRAPRSHRPEPPAPEAAAEEAPTEDTAPEEDAAEAVPAGPPPSDAERDEITDEVVKVLKSIYDPEIPVDIYELGLIYGVDVEDDRTLGIRMTLTSPNCPAAQSLPSEVEVKTRSVEGVHASRVDIVWEPPWGPEKMSEAARLELNIDF